jgi:Domain of unknown function (DUF1844)
VADDNPNPASASNGEPPIGIPAREVAGHPTSAIPLPEHGMATLDLPMRELVSVPAADVISAAATVLIRSGAQRLGLAPGEEPDLDLDEARALITALAGLLAATRERLGEHGEPLIAGLRTLQNAFREASARPDAPGEGPGEDLLS